MEKTPKTKNSSEILDSGGLAAFFTEKEGLDTEEETIVDNNTEEEIEEVFIPPVNIQDNIISGEDNIYLGLVRDFIEGGDWEDVDVEITNEDGTTTNIPITELEGITPEIFSELKEQQRELKKQKFDSKYVDIEDLDERTLKMIKIKKSGGDISQLIEDEAKYVHPLQNLDLDDERVQEYVVRQKYQSQGIDKDIIDFKIAKLKKELTLDSESEKIVKEIDDNFNRFVDSEAKRQEQEILEEQENQKKFRKSMSETLKGYDLKDTLSKTLLDASTKFDKNGLSNVDKAFFEAKTNPELFSKIVFLLTNEEAFDEYWGVKAKNKANKDTLRTVLSLRKRSTETSAVQPKKKKEGLDALFQDN